ncbi:MAG: hypothetical protein QF824_01690 [Candidatus Woesearchaeota archaeon]|jgi:uncharacterized membrane protein YraQ (UPF0718 family)|nr:hypothetical protein [Candidatus Woesearchaeota archaeon]
MKEDKGESKDGKTSKAKKVLLAIAIAIILAMFIGYGINTFYDNPQYDDFCTNPLREKPVLIERDDKECIKVNQENLPQEENCYAEKGSPRYDIDDNGCRAFRECDYCSKEYDEAREEFGKKVFIVSLIAGLLSILVGGLILKVEAVGSGIMGGGILTVLFGTMRYWGNLQDVARWLILGLVLAVLIWVGYKNFKK